MSTIADPAKLKVVELRAELSARGLESKGNKPVLVQRLRVALETESGKDLPDTSIADTSTEDINTSSISQSSPPSRRRRKASEREPSPEPAPPESPPELNKTDEQSEVAALEEDISSETPNAPVEDMNMEESLEEEKEVDTKSPAVEEQESSEENQDDTSDITKEAEEMIEEEKKAKESEEDEEDSKEDKDESKDVDMIEELPVESNKSLDDTASEKEAAEPRNRKSRWGSVTETKDTSDQSDAGNHSVPDIPGVTITSSSDEANARGEKRRHGSPSPERSSRRRSRSPPKEDEPDIDADLVQLSWIDSDLNLQVNKENFTVAEPMHSEGFGYMWAGARSTHGVNSGKVWYEVKLLENCEWKEAPKLEIKDRKHDKNKIETKDKIEDKKETETIDEEKDANKSEIKDTENDENSKESKDAENDVNTPELKEEEHDADKSIPKEEHHADKPIPKDVETDANKTETEDNGDDLKITTDNEEHSSESKSKETDENKIEVDVNKLATEDITSDIEDNDENKMEIKDNEPESIGVETETKEIATEMEVEETLEEEQTSITPVALEHHHILRIGWSLAGTNLQLGEQPHSYAYDSEGFAVTESTFTDYAIKYSVGDVIGAFMNFDTEEITITYSVNGELQPVAFTVPRSELPEDSVLFPHVLTRNIKFEVNYGGNEEPWFQPPGELEDYVLVKNIEEKVIGISRPEKRPDCEVVMMVGLPCSGKTQWVNNHVTNNPDKKYNVLGVAYILDKMKFQGKPRKEHFNASATVLLDKCTRCLNKLIDLASTRRRNYILDQTNLFSSAQRRKMRPFDGFRRHAVVIVVTDDEQTTREKSRQQADGKDVPDSAVLEMKANMSLPSVCDWLDEVTYAELDETKANETVQKYNKQGREAGYGPNYTAKHSNNQRQKGNGDRRGSTGSGGQWNRNNNSGRDSRDRNNRWSGGSNSGHSHNRQNNWGGGNRGSGNYSRQDNRSHHGGGGGGYNRNNPNNRMMPGRGGGGGGGGGGFNRNQGEGGYNRNRNPPPHRNQPNKGGNWSGNGGGGHGNWSNQGNWNNHGGWGHQAPPAQATAGPGWAQGNWGQFSQGQSQQWKGNYGAQQFQQQGYPQGYVAGQYGGQQYPNWNYYGQYTQGWNAQAQSGVAGENANTAQYNQYSQQQQAAWAQYAQSQSGGYGAYGQTPSTQGANTVSGSSSSTQPATK